ncbi:MAG: hypothetical protein KDB87_05520 [Flavobacteriales bacterium]|nr:hypothetical protein [Flavobacteriales bacterium]
MIRALGYACVFLLSLPSCKKDDKVPSYLEVRDPSVSADPLTEGSSSSKITEVWVYVEDEALGVWEPPARVPILASGSQRVQVIAGIRRNGISSDIIQYPFYETWEAPLDLVLQQTTVVEPVFTYFDGLDFWIEAFEDPGYKFTVAAESDTTLYTETDAGLVFEGNASGAFYLDQQRPFFRCVTDEDFTSNGTGPVFLELDYRCDHRFLIGVYYDFGGTVVQEPFLFVSSTKREDGGMPWNKIHVDLSSLFNQPGISDREFYIESQLDLDATSAEFYLDNIKLVRN